MLLTSSMYYVRTPHPTRHRGTGYNGCGRIEKEYYYAYGRKRDTARKMLCDEQQGKVHGSRYKPWHSYFLKLDHRRNKAFIAHQHGHQSPCRLGRQGNHLPSPGVNDFRRQSSDLPTKQMQVSVLRAIFRRRNGVEFTAPYKSKTSRSLLARETQARKKPSSFCCGLRRLSR